MFLRVVGHLDRADLQKRLLASQSTLPRGEGEGEGGLVLGFWVMWQPSYTATSNIRTPYVLRSIIAAPDLPNPGRLWHDLHGQIDKDIVVIIINPNSVDQHGDTGMEHGVHTMS
jgi:hypothetical protein